MYALHTISNLATARTRGTSSHSPLSRDFSSLKCSRTIILIVIALKSLRRLKRIYGRFTPDLGIRSHMHMCIKNKLMCSYGSR